VPIVSSTHTVGHAQVDGRKWVIERHTDHLGAVHERRYKAAPDADYVAIRTARAAQIEAELAEREAAALLDS
jgi:hypothetical protein